jgi:hypothetical protein
MKSTAFLKRLLPIVALFVQAGLAQTYTITDLGTLGGSSSVATGINASSGRSPGLHLWLVMVLSARSRIAMES